MPVSIAPVGTPSVAAAQAPAPAAPPAPPAPPLATQLSQPIVALTRAASGEHVVTLSVTPDNLGPVTVRAHVGSQGIRIELFAPNDLGRDALRGIMPELRRDLAGTGMNSNLQLSAQNQPTSTTSSSNQQGGGAGTNGGLGSGQGSTNGNNGNQDGAASRSERGPALGSPRMDAPNAEPTRAPVRSGQHASSIDVMA
jgi:flagellar hook-length control protein FliK